MDSVVLSIGGSVFGPSLERVLSYSSIVEKIAKEHNVGTVVGGGETARNYIEIAKDMGASQPVCDELGITSTHLNALLLSSGTEKSSFVRDHRKAIEVLSNGKSPIMGGTVPGHTTDAVAAVLAEYIDADFLVYATNVDGVYTMDPKKEGAERLETISPRDLIDIAIKDKRKAGGSAVVDILAARFIERSNIKTLVLDGTSPEKVLDALFEGERQGVTEIIP